MAQKKVYDEEFKIQAVKLGREIGFSKAAKELGVNTDTLYGWNKRAKDARLDLGPGSHTPDSAMSLTEEVQKLRQQNREQAREIVRLQALFSRRAVGGQQKPENAFYCTEDKRRHGERENRTLLSCTWCDKAGILLVFKTPG